MTLLPIFTEMLNALVIDDVVENTKEVPPLIGLGVMDASVDDEIVKSEAYPIVNPLLALHEIVQVMMLPARWGLPMTQDKVELIVGMAVWHAVPRKPTGQL